MIRILVVEDDRRQNQTVCAFLRANGYDATGSESAQEAYDAMYNSLFDLILSDVMMPGIDGFEFAETVRSVNPSIPILFMTARDDFSSKQRGYRAGIDDYMVKPIDLDELLLHIGALLRRAKVVDLKTLTVGNLTMDVDAASILVGGKEILAPPREFNILYKLLAYPNKAFSRQQLLDEFWGLDNPAGLRAVDVYITKIREKYAACDGFQIVTVRGVGYKAVLTCPK